MSKRGYCCNGMAKRSSLSDSNMAINLGARRNSSTALTLTKSSIRESLLSVKRKRNTRCGSGLSG